MEISPAYVDVAIERWQAETGRDAVLEGDGRTFAEIAEERRAASPTEDMRQAQDVAEKPARRRSEAA
jgi:hypothetical protein